MLRYMLDTNILIYTIKSRPEVVRRNFEDHDGEICASSVTAMELLYGAHKSQAVRRNLDVVEGLPGRLTVLDFDLGAAGHARSRGLCLATHNEGEFERVSGLRLANWAK